MRRDVIYTEKNDCQDCYKCIKHCPVKAIKMEDGSASVMGDLCIYCGLCIRNCPVGAKKYRNDLARVQQKIASGKRVVACLAPSVAADFQYLGMKSFVSSLQKLGFSAVSETAGAAGLVAEQSLQWLENQADGLYISTCCPVVVNYISIYFPELKDKLVPVQSPMLAQGNQLKHHFDNDVFNVFIGPCIAKKKEAEQFPGTIDAVLTFQEVQNWLAQKGLDKELKNDDFPPNFILGKSDKGRLFPVDGGMLANMKENVAAMDVSFMAFSGMKQVKDIVAELAAQNTRGKIFLELMACEGGCIKGPGCASDAGLVAKRSAILNQKECLPEQITLNISGLDYHRHFGAIKPAFHCFHSREEISNELHSFGKWTEKDELNCTGCGYDNCREFMKALLDGKAERNMCITYMRKVAQNKASVLLQKIPSGVVMVDENLHIIDCNRKFVELLGENAQQIFEETPGMAGIDLTKLVPYHKLFSSLLYAGDEMIEQDIREGDDYYHVSVISIQKYKIACGIVENMRDPEIQKEKMVERIREVIRQNLESVQRIAYLLGENASFTESMLNSVLESHDAGFSDEFKSFNNTAVYDKG
jgi:iron only hydrogenase large subunit-like protein